MRARIAWACMAGLLIAGCGGQAPDQKTSSDETSQSAGPAKGGPGGAYSEPAVLTEADIQKLMACIKDMETVKIDPMPKDGASVEVIEALGSPTRLGAFVEKQPKGKEILAKHGLTGPKMCHQMLTAAAGLDVVGKSKDWADYQDKAKKKPGQVESTLNMMRRMMETEAGLKELAGEEKARKQKEIDRMTKAWRQMLKLMADYAHGMPRQSYDVIVKHRTTLEAMMP